jgi:methionine sulfoxide reductase catalytic subunit
MNIIKRKGWEIPATLVTPEAAFLNRRQALALAGISVLGIGGNAQAATNATFADAGRPVTEESYNTTYNNFYEFGTSKQIFSAAEALPVKPWQIAIDGEVEQPVTLDVADLIAKMPIEDRIVRHRCVEAWAMVVPWTGFPLNKLVEMAKPKSSAKYVRFETFNLPDVAPGQKDGLFSSYPWPYVEGITIEEAMNDLSFMVTGAYGKPLAKSMGAPIRLHLPWKYGFKSAKSLVKISFTADRPMNFWQALNANEYGFWANVNPEVPHPRWSQASEEMLGTGERVPTKIFNGYGEFVSGLYKGLEKEPLFM